MRDPRFSTTTREIIGACIDVHREIGRGLLESAYEACVAHELGVRGIAFQQQPVVPLEFKGMYLSTAFRPDFVVADTVILEIKSVDAFTSAHLAQVRTYLRLMRLDVGLLINFNVHVLRDGIRRVCSSPSSSSPPPPP